MNFTVIDFETPNNTHASICQMGITVVENNIIKENLTYMVKPEPFYFDFYNIKIHGIQAKDVRNMPTLSQLWPKVLPYFKNKTIVAHNVLFDISVLKKNLLFYNIPCPKFNYFCSYDLSKAAWQGFENYRLDTVAENLGLKFKHHDAGQDSFIAAQIVVQALGKYKINSLSSLSKKLQIPIYKSSDINHSFEKTPTTKVFASSITPINNKFDKKHPFFGKTIVVTGRFATMTRKGLYQKLADVGAIIEDKVTSQTDILAIGAIDRNKNTLKRKVAEEFINNGANIKLCQEKEFLLSLGHVISHK